MMAETATVMAPPIVTVVAEGAPQGRGLMGPMPAAVPEQPLNPTAAPAATDLLLLQQTGKRPHRDPAGVEVALIVTAIEPAALVLPARSGLPTT